MPKEPKATRVMVLQDDARLLEELRQAAQRHNLDLATARTASEVRSGLLQSPADVVVLPARMAGTDGVLLTTELRQDLPHTAFLLITALHSASLEQLAARAGARALLTKPIDVDRLAQAIHRVHQEQLRCRDEPLGAWDTPELWAQLADLHEETGLVMSLATPQGSLLRTIGQRNQLCSQIRSNPQHLTAICQTVAAAMSAELEVSRSPVDDLCDAGMRRVVIPIVCRGELVGQVTGCGVATEPEEPDADMLSVQLGLSDDQARKLARRVSHTSVEAILQALEPLRKAVQTDHSPGSSTSATA